MVSFYHILIIFSLFRLQELLLFVISLDFSYLFIVNYNRSSYYRPLSLLGVYVIFLRY